MRTNQATIYPGVGQSIGIAGIVIGGTLLCTPVGMMLDSLLGKEASALMYYLGAMGSSLLVVAAIQKKKSGAVSFKFRPASPATMALLIAGGAALSYGVILPVTALLPLPEDVQRAFAGSLTRQGPLTCILLVLVAPALEELIFRGIMLEGLLKKYTPVRAVAVSSVLFGVVHLNPWQCVAGFILAGFIGWVYCLTRNVFYAMLTHAAVNGSGYLLRRWNDPKTLVNGSLTDLYGGPETFATLLGAAFLVLTVSAYVLHKQFRAAGAIEPLQSQPS